MSLIAVGFLVFLLLTLAGLEIWLVMGATALLVVLAQFGRPDMMAVAPQSMLDGVSGLELAGIPLFILAGELMNRGGITERLLLLAQAILGGIRGGLAMVGVLVNMLMAGVSGSAVADSSATASVLLPAMRRDGYDPDYSAALIGAAATIGPIIPPSIPFIVFGALTQVSVAKLFLAGVAPGALMGATLLAVAWFIARRAGHPVAPFPGLTQAPRLIAQAIVPLFMPVFVIAGIILGFATVTEIAALAVAYALVVGLAVYRSIRVADLPQILGEAARMSAIIMITLATAAAFSWAMTALRIGPQLAALITSLDAGPVAVLLMINVLLLLVGCIFEPLPAMVIFVPILMPIIGPLGIDPVHFGLIVVLNLMIGLLSPPVGLNLYITASIANRPVEGVIRRVVPFFAALVAVLLICTLWPGFVLFLPDLVR
ncbi:MAG: TRAP transporter large permease [Pseudomonadota bacterium]